MRRSRSLPSFGSPCRYDPKREILRILSRDGERFTTPCSRFLISSFLMASIVLFSRSGGQGVASTAHLRSSPNSSELRRVPLACRRCTAQMSQLVHYRRASQITCARRCTASSWGRTAGRVRGRRTSPSPYPLPLRWERMFWATANFQGSWLRAEHGTPRCRL